MRPGFLRPLVAVVSVALVAATPGGVSGQTSPDSRGSPPDSALMEQGELLHDQLLPLDALDRFEAVVARDSLHYEARWKAAREAVNAGMLAEDDEREKEWYVRAEGHARTALDAGGDGVEAHHWLSVALGRRALREGVRTRVRLAEEVRDHATAVLAADSLHPGAHHVLGQWHAEVRRLSGFERWVARKLLGGDSMDEASWDEARDHLRRAVELAPGTIIHRLELARVHLDLGEDDVARRHLEQILTLPAAEPTDPLHKQEAQDLLREMG